MLVRGIRAGDLDNITSIAKNIKQGTLEGFDEGQGVAIGRRLADQLSVHAGDNITLVAPSGAVTPCLRNIREPMRCSGSGSVTVRLPRSSVLRFR